MCNCASDVLTTVSVVAIVNAANVAVEPGPDTAVAATGGLLSDIAAVAATVSAYDISVKITAPVLSGSAQNSCDCRA